MEYHNDTIVRYNFDHKIETSAIIGHSLLIATQADGIMALNGKMFIPIPGHELLYNKKYVPLSLTETCLCLSPTFMDYTYSTAKRLLP